MLDGVVRLFRPEDGNAPFAVLYGEENCKFATALVEVLQNLYSTSKTVLFKPLVNMNDLRTVHASHAKTLNFFIVLSHKSPSIDKLKPYLNLFLNQNLVIICEGDLGMASKLCGYETEYKTLLMDVSGGEKSKKALEVLILIEKKLYAYQVRQLHHCVNLEAPAFPKDILFTYDSSPRSQLSESLPTRGEVKGTGSPRMVRRGSSILRGLTLSPSDEYHSSNSDIRTSSSGSNTSSPRALVAQLKELQEKVEHLAGRVELLEKNQKPGTLLSALQLDCAKAESLREATSASPPRRSHSDPRLEKKTP